MKKGANLFVGIMTFGGMIAAMIMGDAVWSGVFGFLSAVNLASYFMANPMKEEKTEG